MDTDHRTQFTFYESFYKSLSHLKTHADRAKTYDAICRFALYGEEPDLSGPSAAVLEIVRPILEASRKKSAAGKSGGSKQKANGKQNESNSEASTTEKQVQVQVQVQDKEQYVIPPKTSSSRKFCPPSVSEVEEYIREKGYHIDPEAFVAFYTSKGWRVGSSPMKDWRAAVLTWERKERRDNPGEVSAREYYEDFQRRLHGEDED